MTGAITAGWIDFYREPRVAPNALYPTGKDVDVSHGASRACMKLLPYPARRCGIYMVRCVTCGASAGITTAGRPDDPRSVKLPCKR